MKLFTKKQNLIVKKYAIISTTGKGYNVQYRTPRKLVHNGQY